MYMRMVQVRIKQGALQKVLALYRNRVITSLEHVEGCRYAGFMVSAHHAEECISLTLWNSKKDADQYEASGLFSRLIDEMRPHFVESSESRIQLSRDLKLEYVPVPEEPVISASDVAAAGSAETASQHNDGKIWVRIVSLKLRPGKMEEYKTSYLEHVVPRLKTVTGCRYVYLAERTGKPNEVISVTSWSSRQDAETYERSGVFAALLESQRHLLSELYQWKQSTERTQHLEVTTSEDVAIEQYDVVAGRSFV